MFEWFKKLFRKSKGVIVEKKRVKEEVYRDKGGQWRWRLVAINGNIIANSGEGYKNKLDCVEMIDGIVEGVNVVERIVPK